MGSVGDRWVLLEGVIGFALWTIMSAGRLAATAVDGDRSAGSMPDRRQGAESINLKRAVSDQLSAFGFTFQEFLTTRCITCRVGACGSKTARKMLMHLWLTADR